MEISILLVSSIYKNTEKIKEFMSMNFVSSFATL